MKAEDYLQIKLKYNTFTAAHKKLADFVLNNPEFVLNQSISEVAAACDVGEATISRFCRVLGFKGYHDFKLSIVKHLQKEEQEHAGEHPGEDESSVLSGAQKILNQTVRTLNETCNLLQEDDINRAVDYLLNAGRIAFFGVGSSFTTAMEGYGRFARITPKVCINAETHMQYVTASLMNKDDVAVVISYSGSTKEIVEIARTAKNRGAKIICITRYLKSPLTSYSDVSLLCSADERSAYGNTLSMKPAQLFLLDILYTEFFKRDPEAFQANREISSASLSDKLF